MFLLREVISDAKELVDSEKVSTKASKTLFEVLALFKERWGDPKNGVILSGPEDPNKKKAPPKPQDPNGKKKGDDEDEKKRERRGPIMSIKIGEDVFQIKSSYLTALSFAQINPDEPSTIFVNIKEGRYAALPGNNFERREHCLMHILLAVGRFKRPDDFGEAIQFANEMRSELLNK